LELVGRYLKRKARFVPRSNASAIGIRASFDLQALELRKRLLGDAPSSVATNLNNLAALYSSQGRYAEAEPLLQQALKLSKRLLGKDHPSVATSLNSLADLYIYQARYTEAEALLQQALELRKRLLGEEHPSVASVCTIWQHSTRLKEGMPKPSRCIWKP
jgi:tetratricopeptide (TPR) repeat protein